MKCNRCRKHEARRGFKSCSNCGTRTAMWERERRMPDRIEYTPLDETLDSPQTKVLQRLIRFDDWVNHEDLMDSFGVTSVVERSPYVTALSRLMKAGSVEKRKMKTKYPRGGGNGGWWRVTESGRAELARRLQTDMAVEDDGYRDTEAA